MKPKRTHTIVKTYINKRGHLLSHTTGVVGGTDKEAMRHFNSAVAAAGTTHKQIVGVVLIDAGDNALAEWTKPVESERAA